MSPQERYASVLRLSRSQPENIDDLLARLDTRAGPSGRDLSPCPEAVALPDLPLAGEEAVAVGVSVTRPLSDPADVAARLCALSIEQDVEIVVLSHLDYSGLERFGFRTERVTGETDAEVEACLAELKRFWGIELVIPT